MSDQERKVYDFKSVGELEEKRLENVRNDFEGIPFGISTPVALSSGNTHLFEMNHDLVDQIVDNFRNMISTNHGERMIFTDFGANLLPLVFKLGDQDFDEIALLSIKKTTDKYMPFVKLETYEPERIRSESEGLAKVIVRIGFSIPTLGVTGKMIESTIYAGG